MTNLTPEQLREYTNYNPDTGIFTWKKKTGCKSVVGAEIGTAHSGGYRSATIMKHYVFMHRAAWAYVHGEWPKGHIDHIDGNPKNNRIANLRVATSQTNQRNRKISKSNKSGFKGVHQVASGKWVAMICVDYKSRSLGHFNTAEEAHARYMEEARKLYGEFARAA